MVLFVKWQQGVIEIHYQIAQAPLLKQEKDKPAVKQERETNMLTEIAVLPH